VGPRAGLDGRKISSPPGFDPGLSSPQSVTIPTELPGPPSYIIRVIKSRRKRWARQVACIEGRKVSFRKVKKVSTLNTYAQVGYMLKCILKKYVD